ncbi:MAG: hypothetical protein IPM68_05760 [Flavobacteriales bacterium]|nr:hypothetical protein [Flavobacteriales bacterium]
MNLLSAWTITGDLLWSTGFADMVFVDGEVAAGPDSSILACGRWNGCDVGGANSIITRINGDGSTAWSVPVAVDGLQHIATHADSLLAFATDAAVHLTGVNGDSLTQWSTLTHRWRPCAGPPMATCSWPRTTPSTLPPPPDPARHHTHRWRCAPARSPARRPHLGAPGRRVAQRVRGPAVYHRLRPQRLHHRRAPACHRWQRRLGADAHRGRAGGRLLGPIGSFPLDPLPGHQVADLAFGNGRLTTAGHADLFTTSAAVLRDYDSAGLSAAHDVDVSITIASVDSVWLQPVAPPSVHTLHAALTLTLTNHGNSVVHELLLSHQLGQAWFCGIIGTMLPLTQLNLQPGQSMDVPFALTTGFPQPYPPGSTATANVCIVAASPQQRVDRAPADNQACTTVSIVGVGVPSHQAGIAFTVSPNPFQQELRLSLEPAAGAVEVIVRDQLGRPVHAERIGSGIAADHPLVLPALASGLYALTVRGAG